MPRKMLSKKWLEENIAWRVAALQLIKRWARDAGQPVDDAAFKIIVKRFQKLEDYIRILYPDHHPAPFAVEDAAALIVAPRYLAKRIISTLFDRSLWEPEWTSNFNLDWFTPPTY